MAAKLSNDQFLLKHTILPHEYEQAKGVTDKSTFFEYFAATQWLKECNFSADEILSGIVGSAHDGGCDGFYLTYNGVLVNDDVVDTLVLMRNAILDVYVLQAKEELGFGEDAVMKLKTVSDNLLKLDVSDDAYVTRYNEGVRAAFSLFRKFYQRAVVKQVVLRFHYAYVALSESVHPNVSAQANELKELVRSNFPNAEVSFDFIGAKDLLLRYQATNDLRLILPLVAPPIALGDKNEYVALVKLADFFGFISDADSGGALRKVMFESNVRDYQGSNISVNRKIQETLLSNKTDDFWWLNNGITILAETAEQIGGSKLQIGKPEIVNGLQTTSEIYAFFNKYPSLLNDEKRSLLIRVIVPGSEETRDNIICATNSQTPVNSASLRVTGVIHRKIETYCKGRGLYYDRRKNQYKNEGHPASEVVSVLFLGQCMVSILLQLPDYARARPSQILSDDAKYTKLYDDNVPLVVFYNCAKVGKLINAFLAQKEELTPAQRRNILFHVIFATVAFLSKTTTPTVFDVEKIDMGSVTAELMEKVFAAVLDIFRAKGGSDKVAKGTEFTEAVATWVDVQCRV